MGQWAPVACSSPLQPTSGGEFIRGMEEEEEEEEEEKKEVCVECLIGKQNKPTLFKVTGRGGCKRLFAFNENFYWY